MRTQQHDVNSSSGNHPYLHRDSFSHHNIESPLAQKQNQDLKKFSNASLVPPVE